MGKARDFKFGVRIDRLAYKPKNAKVGHKGRGLRHVTYFLKFGTTSIFLEWVQLDFKFGVPIDRQAYKPKLQK